MVTATQVSYSYTKSRTPVFQNLSLVLEPGKIYGLLGKNGAGKTTLLKILTGLLFPDEGEVLLDQVSVTGRRPETLSRVFYLPETFSLPNILPLSYVKLYSPFYPHFQSADFEQYLQGLEVPLDKPLSSLSYGQQKKFMIAFGMGCHCDFCFMDEPTNGLDIPSKSQFRRLLAGYSSEQKTLIISTHQARDLEGLIDPVVVLEGGCIPFQKSREDIDRLWKQVVTPEPQPQVLYTEKVLGGWVSLVPQTPPARESSVDLELLFNAIISQPHLFNTPQESSHE